jgi:RNA recognition motif-containing protein
VRNLEERVKIDELKEALSEIFSEYGDILEIVAKKNLKAKGQAFIVFDNVESAQRAIEEVNGFDLLGKPMVLDFAKTRSDATVMSENGPDEFEVHKRRRLAEKGKCMKWVCWCEILANATRLPVQNGNKLMKLLRHRRN